MEEYVVESLGSHESRQLFLGNELEIMRGISALSEFKE